ncbi:Clathrin/coatomer adaptor, adaptin-like, N-terminal, partial [Sesbania bispinosa]
SLTPYEKKKHVSKMLHIYMLGSDVDFGHMEAVSLISAPKFPEKQVGYIVTLSLLNENHDFLRLVINTVRNDIINRNETFQCLALTMENMTRMFMITDVQDIIKRHQTQIITSLKDPDI